MITTRNYITCADDPTGMDVLTEQPHQTRAAPDSERVGSAECQLADHQAAAPETPLSGRQNVSVLSGPRLELLALNSQLAEASAALARCNQPVGRLQQLIADADRAEQDLGARRCRYESELADWIAAGCRADRPPVPPELVAAERELGQLQVDARAARGAMGDHTAVAAEAARHVAELGTRRNQAHILAAIQACREFTAAHFTPALQTYRQSENTLRNIEDALSASGAHGAAAEIRRLIDTAKSVAPPKADIAAGQKFLSTLMADPGARL